MALVDMTPKGHGLRVVAVGTGRQAQCACGWEGTVMQAPNGHQAAIDQYASHLKGLSA
jgi:hypothetical protein